MKYIIILISCVFLIVFAGSLSVIGSNTQGQKSSGSDAAAPSDQVTWEVPIAAGIYYPSDGPVPNKLVRYYRVRCWPGCHTGSTLGNHGFNNLFGPDTYELRWMPGKAFTCSKGQTGNSIERSDIIRLYLPEKITVIPGTFLYMSDMVSYRPDRLFGNFISRQKFPR